MDQTDGPQRFSVDVKGLLEALTEQFPEPLLCVRELIQNAADAHAHRIEVDVSYDRARSLLRLSVRDDGRGMSPAEVDGYLTIGFSEKDPNRDRGRFGVGKLSPYALGIERMVVETSTGQHATRLSFFEDGSGHVTPLELRTKGTVVRVYKSCGREEAESLAERTAELVEDRCGSIPIPLFVNGVQVNHEITLPTPYAVTFSGPEGEGVIGLVAEPLRTLMGGRIVLETDATILGPDISYILDSARLSPTLSRNAVRRDSAFESLLRAAQAHLPGLTDRISEELRARVGRAKKRGLPVERELDSNDRAALEWLRTQLLEPDEAPSGAVRQAPVLETADGGLVSAQELIDVIRREHRVPTSRIPRTRDEIAAYADRGMPVLLLYRDLEDFLERQGIETVEVDESEVGVEVSPGDWGPGEQALAQRVPLGMQRPGQRWGRGLVYAGLAALVLAGLFAVSTRIAPETLGGSPSPVEIASGEGASRADLDEPERFTAPSETIGGSAREAGVAALAEPARTRWRSAVVFLAGLLAVLSAAAGLALLVLSLGKKKSRTISWLSAEAGTPLKLGHGRTRRWEVLSRAVFHPIDFFVARGWSVRSSGSRSGPAAIKGYRELAPEPQIRSGVRLDLDRVQLGFVELVSSVGEPHDGRILLRRNDRVLLNRNHPTVRDLICVASKDSKRARVLLDALLATDPELARGTDPRQAEWDLLSRAEHLLRSE